MAHTIHNDVIMNTLEKITDILNNCVNTTIPRQQGNSRRGIPKWNECVKPYKEKSISWNDIWKNAGCPSSGQLADLRRFSRPKYHWAIKQAQTNADNILKERASLSLKNKLLTITIGTT